MAPPGSPQVGNWVSGLESSTPSSPIGGSLANRRGGPRGRLDESDESLSSVSGGGGGCPSNGCGNWLLLVTTAALLALVVLLVASLLQLILAAGSPHTYSINSGGLIPIPDINVEAIVAKIASLFWKNEEEKPFRADEVLPPPSPGPDVQHENDPEGDVEPRPDEAEDPDDPEDPDEDIEGASDENGDEDDPPEHNLPPFGSTSTQAPHDVVRNEPNYGLTSRRPFNRVHEILKGTAGNPNQWNPQDTRNSYGVVGVRPPYPPLGGSREYVPPETSTPTTTSTTEQSQDNSEIPTFGVFGNNAQNTSRKNASVAVRELWCHIYANAGLKDDQLQILSDHCNYVLIDSEVHLQGTGLMPKVVSDGHILNRIRSAMPSSVKLLLATKDFDSGFDKLLDTDDNEGGDEEHKFRSSSIPPLSPKLAQAFDAVIGLLKRYQTQGLALRELDGAKHYNQGDKGERSQLRARWAVLYMQLAEYLAEKGFEHAFMVKPSLDRYREYSLRMVVNEGLGPVLLMSGALRAATSTLCVSPYKWVRDKRVITQTKVLKEAKDYFGKTWKRNLVFAMAPFVTNCRVYNKTAVYNCTRNYYSEFCKHASRGMLIEGTMRYGAESDCFSAQTRQDDSQVILWTGMGPMSGQFIKSLGQSRGLMLYNAFADDKEGLCGFGPFPLLKAVHDALDGKQNLQEHSNRASSST